MRHSIKVLFFVFLLLGLASADYAETCPDDDEINPCTCTADSDSGEILVICSHEDISLEELKKALNGLSGKKNIELVLIALNLGTVPSDFFNGIEIKKLDISHCELDSLSEDGSNALHGLEDSLEELIITASFTEENVPAKLDLSHMRKLKDLEVSYNVITELGNDWFEKGPPALEYLTISNNGIEKIGDRAFSNLINLKRLSLDGNRFGPLQRDIFPPYANHLETLELDNNALTSLPKDIFGSMTSLVEISLRSNGILRLEPETWKPVWNHLQYLFIDGNPIECDSHLDWINTSPGPEISGECRSPPEMYGKEIQDFLDSRIPKL